MTRTIGPVTATTGGAAAGTTALIWILSLFGIDMPTEVAGAFITLAVIVAGYFAPPGKQFSDDGKHVAQ